MECTDKLVNKIMNGENITPFDLKSILYPLTDDQESREFLAGQLQHSAESMLIEFSPNNWIERHKVGYVSITDAENSISLWIRAVETFKKCMEVKEMILHLHELNEYY